MAGKKDKAGAGRSVTTAGGAGEPTGMAAAQVAQDRYTAAEQNAANVYAAGLAGKASQADLDRAYRARDEAKAAAARAFSKAVDSIERRRSEEQRAGAGTGKGVSVAGLAGAGRAVRRNAAAAAKTKRLFK